MNHNLKCNCRLIEYVRGFCPVPGNDYRKAILVALGPGDKVSEHQHTGHTVLYYPDPATPVVFTPTPGSMIYLPPRTLHNVPEVSRDRISIAMIVDTL